MNTLKHPEVAQSTSGSMQDVFAKLAKSADEKENRTVHLAQQTTHRRLVGIEAHTPHQSSIMSQETRANTNASSTPKKSDHFKEYTLLDGVKYVVAATALIAASVVGSNYEKRPCSTQEKSSIGASECRR